MREDISDIFEFGFAPEWNVNVGVDYFQPLADFGRAILRANYAWADETVGNFGQPDPAGLGRNVFSDRGKWDFSAIWQNPWVDTAVYVKDAFHKDNYLATSMMTWSSGSVPSRRGVPGVSS